MPDAQELADQIIKRAQDGYHGRDDYPPYALAPWDDRTRWTEYLKKVMVEVLAEELK